MKTKLLLCGLLVGVLGLASGELRAQSDEPKQTTAVPLGGGGFLEVEPHIPQFGAVVRNVDNQVEVLKVFKGSPASRLGLEAGDRIVEINSYRCRNTRQLSYLLQLAVEQNRGEIRVIIDNVRARTGAPEAERFSYSKTWLDGHGVYSSDDRPLEYKNGSGGQ